MTHLKYSSIVLIAALCGPIRADGQQARPAVEVNDAQMAATSLAGAIVLGPGDTIRITSLSSEEISKEWRIGESGALHLPLVGAIDVAGKTAAALEAELEVAYRDYLVDPKIDVFVSELRSRPVTVVGAVGEPGTHQLTGPTTLFHLVQQAGGITPEGSRIVIIRDSKWGVEGLPRATLLPDGKVESELSIEEVLKGHGPQAQTPIQPFDVINVEPKRERLVYIAGGVHRPGALVLESADGVSLTKALVMAGGYKSSAAFNHTYLWRSNDGANGSVELDLRDVVRGKSEDLTLREGDYLIVPPRGGKFANMQGMAAIMQITTSAIFILGRL